MKHKGINVITSLFVLLPSLPVAANETNVNTSILSDRDLQCVTDVVTQTSAIIEEVCDSIQVEAVSSDTENTIVEKYYYTSPVYYSAVEGVPSESTVQVTYETEESAVLDGSSVDVLHAEQEYQNALTMYNEALEQYNSANEIIENQEEVEVEVLQEIVDEEGNVSIITNFEVQTVITTETAGDVGAAQEVLNQTSLQLSEAENALAQAQSDSVIREEDLITAVQDSELKAVNEESNKCGDNATWSISDSGVLTVTGSGDMYDYASGSETPWISEKLRINHIVIDTGITRVGDFAFSGCDHIQTAYLYNTTTSVGTRAFDSCTRLTGVHFGDGVTTIEASAFNNCPVLEILEFNNSLETIGNNAFEKCTSIEELVLPDSLITVGSQAFSSCTGLTSVHFGSNTNTIEASAFRYCSALKVLEFNNSLETIGRNAFDGCQAIEEIELPDSLNTIGSYAFNRCWSLRNVDLGNGVESIGSQAFYDCNKIESIVIPSSVTTIDGGAFNQCKSLTEVTFNEGLSKIGISAFNACVNLLTVNLPESVTSIGLKAFEACESLTAININENNSYYASVNGVLYSKDKKTLIKCPGGLTETNILDNVTSIAQFAFSTCGKIVSLVLPNKLLSIGQSAFYDCSLLNSIILPDSITELGTEVFKSCQALESVVIGSGITVLPAKAFSGCSSLATIVLNKTLSSIDETTFEFCTAISDVYYHGTESEWIEKALFEFPETVTMHFEESDFPFTDVPADAWYYNVAKECYETGLISGTSSTTFSPLQEMTRAMVVTILWRLEGQPAVAFDDTFSDVSSRQWYATSISWAVQAGVVHGYGDGTFKPDAAVTREQVAVMLANYAQYKGVYVPGTKRLDSYPDGYQVSTWAQSGMKWALTEGIMTGNGAGYLNPKKSATRAEGAAMLLRMKNWL